MKRTLLALVSLCGLILIADNAHELFYVQPPFHAALARWETAYQARDLPAVKVAVADACEALGRKWFIGAPRDCP